MKRKDITKIKDIVISERKRFCRIFIEENLLEKSEFIDFCGKQGENFVVICDNKIKNFGRNIFLSLQKRKKKVFFLAISSGEKNKTRKMKEEIEDKLFSNKCDKNTCLIAIGGGTTLDLLLFVASTFLRGIACILVPTTLLAIVDAGIGGKCGVNTIYGKNLIGTTCMPQGVAIDKKSLETIPEIEWKIGFVEMIKHALIGKRKDFIYFEKYLNDKESIFQKPSFFDKVVDSIKIKKKIIEKDFFDKKERNYLNFGHTFAHAIERAEDFSLSHGLAVAIGIVGESYLSYKSGFLPQKEFLRIVSLIEKLKLSYLLKKGKKKKIKEALFFDKKNKKNQPYFVLLKAIGQPYRGKEKKCTFSVKEVFIDEAIDYMIKIFSKNESKSF